MARFDRKVMLADVRMKLNVLHLLAVLSFACEFFLLLVFVLELPELDDLAHRGIRVRRDLDEIPFALAGNAQGVPCLKHSKLFTMFVHNPDDRYTNLLIDPRTLFFCYSIAP